MLTLTLRGDLVEPGRRRGVVRGRGRRRGRDRRGAGRRRGEARVRRRGRAEGWRRGRGRGRGCEIREEIVVVVVVPAGAPERVRGGARRRDDAARDGVGRGSGDVRADRARVGGGLDEPRARGRDGLGDAERAGVPVVPAEEGTDAPRLPDEAHAVGRIRGGRARGAAVRRVDGRGDRLRLTPRRRGLGIDPGGPRDVRARRSIGRPGICLILIPETSRVVVPVARPPVVAHVRPLVVALGIRVRGRRRPRRRVRHGARRGAGGPRDARSSFEPDTHAAAFYSSRRADADILRWQLGSRAAVIGGEFGRAT